VCSTAVLHTTGYDFGCFKPAGVERAIRKLIKVTSKVALRFAGA